VTGRAAKTQKLPISLISLHHLQEKCRERNQRKIQVHWENGCHIGDGAGLSPKSLTNSEVIK